MRAVVLIVGLHIAHGLTTGGILPTEQESGERFLIFITVLFIYAVILDLWKKT